MKIKVIFSRTVVTQVDSWPDFRTVEVEVPDEFRDNGAPYGEWHLIGAITEERQA